jgi:hypothetical protein
VSQHDSQARAASSRGPVRTVEWGGVVWRVWEAHIGPYDRRSGPHLFFESAGAVRRVREYPADWHTLPDDALMRVADHR